MAIVGLCPYWETGKEFQPEAEVNITLNHIDLLLPGLQFYKLPKQHHLSTSIQAHFTFKL